MVDTTRGTAPSKYVRHLRPRPRTREIRAPSLHSRLSRTRWPRSRFRTLAPLRATPPTRHSLLPSCRRSRFQRHPLHTRTPLTTTTPTTTSTGGGSTSTSTTTSANLCRGRDPLPSNRGRWCRRAASRPTSSVRHRGAAIPSCRSRPRGPRRRLDPTRFVRFRARVGPWTPPRGDDSVSASLNRRAPCGRPPPTPRVCDDAARVTTTRTTTTDATPVTRFLSARVFGRAQRRAGRKGIRARACGMRRRVRWRRVRTRSCPRRRRRLRLRPPPLRLMLGLP